MNTQSFETTPEMSVMAPEIVAYEAPAIESVLTAESLEREVQYAGTPTSGLPTSPR